MRTRYLFPALLTLLAGLACTVTLPSPRTITGSGNVVTIERDEAGFDRLAISHAFEAAVQQSDTYRVTVRMDDNLQQYLRVAKVGQTLEVGLDLQGVNLQRAMLRVEIAMPALRSVTASGASHAALTGFTSDADLQAEASGASSIQGEIEAGEARLNVSGASSVELVGRCTGLTLDVSGASAAELLAFECGDISAVLSGASNAVVYASGRLDADVSGASNLEYAGEPTLGTVTSTGASSVGEH